MTSDSDKLEWMAILDRVEDALREGDTRTARGLLTGMEPRLLAAGLQTQIPCFFRLAAECEIRDGHPIEALRLALKGLDRTPSSASPEWQHLVCLSGRLIRDLDPSPDAEFDSGRLPKPPRPFGTG